ncbi:hypothetical protein ACHAWC_006142 [Mediolabrus comicus]
MKRHHLSVALVFWTLIIKAATSFSSRSKKFPCKSTAEVTAAIDIYVKSDDNVIELGAQLSDISTCLCRAVGTDGKAVLVDVKRKDATSGRSKGRDTTPFLGPTSQYSSSSSSKDDFVDRVQYHELDQFDQWREITRGNNYQVMILDVLGR